MHAEVEKLNFNSCHPTVGGSSSASRAAGSRSFPKAAHHFIIETLRRVMDRITAHFAICALDICPDLTLSEESYLDLYHGVVERQDTLGISARQPATGFIRSRVVPAVSGRWHRMRRLGDYRHAIRSLQALDDRTLRDIGTSRDQITHIVRGETG